MVYEFAARRTVIGRNLSYVEGGAKLIYKPHLTEIMVGRNFAMLPCPAIEAPMNSTQHRCLSCLTVSVLADVLRMLPWDHEIRLHCCAYI